MKSYLFEDICLGLEENFSVFVNEEIINKFTSITQDLNPLHIDEVYAVSKGFNSRVVYGLLTSSFYSTLVGMHLPGKFCILHGINIKFTKPVYMNDCLKIVGQVSYINHAYKQIEIKAKIFNQDNSVISKAIIKVGLLNE